MERDLEHLYPILLPGNVWARPGGVPTPKNIFASVEKLGKICEFTFYENKNQRKSLTNSILVIVSLPNLKLV
jgi:hypothetical protein